jgi:hypothetical protein
MSLGPAKVRVEIFREPALFDDSFAKGWTTITGSFASDGDVAAVIGFGAVGRIEKTVTAIDTDENAQLALRVTVVGGTGTKWGLKVYDDIVPEWVTIFTGKPFVGLYEVILPAGKSITKIALLEETVGDVTNRVDFDYVIIAKNAMLLPDMGDLVEELRITHPLLNSGIAGAHLSIPNFSGAPGPTLYDVLISIMKGGEHYAGAQVQIGDQTYNDGDTAHLQAMTHTLSPIIPDDVFDVWDVVDVNIEVDVEEEASTYLIVLGTGSDELILYLETGCPDSEQLINWGFETGDLTGWDYVLVPIIKTNYGSIYPHHGSYMVYLDTGVAISQDVNVPVECFDEEAGGKLEFYWCAWFGGCGEGGTHIHCRLTYTDDTYTDVLPPENTDSSWNWVNLLPYLEAGKTLKRIAIYYDDSGYGRWALVDCVSCVPWV